ncbi:MAG: EamA family transporter [Candidatus Parcubacteria bacterium]|nr:EamA family transporter [Candidatus Parcubacteria bacterium]
MYWILLALISPILLTLVNHLDKYLLEKYFKDGGVGALMIFSSLAGILVLPFALFFSSENVFRMPLYFIAILIIVGILSTLAVFAYLFALEDEEATVVVPFYQTIPIFSGVLGYFFLGEKITTPQMIGMFIIIAGSIILSLELDEINNFKFKTKAVVLMLISSFLFTINAIIFKIIALESSFWTSIFWENMGLFLTGLFIFIFFKKYRKLFLWVFKENRGKIMTFNIIGEVLVLIGNISLQYALILAPVALVLLVDSYQPIFVLIWAFIFYFLYPKIFREKLDKKNLIKKVASILIIGLGTTIVYIF